MKEHAIPQDVTGYKFHIVGNMTLGQFAQLVVGAIISFSLYSTNLYAVIKWPIIFIAVILSVVAAFVPIAERPLSHWIKTFFFVLYRPTQFAWRRIPHIPEPFLFQPIADTGPVLPELDLTPMRRQRIQDFLSTTHATAGEDSETQQVDRYYEHVFSLFNSDSTTNATSLTEVPPIQVNKPSLRVRTRSMRASPSTPISLETALTAPELVIPELEIPALEAPERVTPDAPVIDTIGYTTSRKVELPQYIETSVAAPLPDGAETKTSAPKRRGADTTTSEVMIPADAIPKIEPTALDTPPLEESGSNLQNGTLVTQTPQNPLNAVSSVTFNKALPFPSTPTTANKLVGMTLTSKNELIEGAIIEIRTPDGQVARAVRSNALGQFYVTTPLANGDYVMVAEKAGRHFEPLSIKLKGKIVDPIEIRSSS